MSTATAPSPADIAPERLYRLSLDVYHEMAEHGLITTANRIVLLDGLLVKKMTKNPSHVTATQRAFDALTGVLPAGWYVRKEDPILLPAGPGGTDSEPEPDLAVVRGDVNTFATRHPVASVITLVVEVADTTLADDRNALRRYAWAKIPVVWIVNLANQTVEVYSGPSGPGNAPGYAHREVKEAGASLMVLIDGQPRDPIAVAMIFS